MSRAGFTMRQAWGSRVTVRLRMASPRTLWALILVSYLPLLQPFFRSVWASEHYRFFPLVVAGFAALVWLRLHEDVSDRPPVRGTAERQNLWLVAAWLLLSAAVLLWSPWLAAASAIVAARAVLLQVGSQSGQRLTGEWLLLWLLLPLPFRWDARLNFWIESSAARWGGYVLDFLRVPNLVAGFSIQVPRQSLLVDDACTGLASAVLLFALAAMFILWMRRPVVPSLLLLGSTLYWAVAVNVVRVVAVSYSAVAFERDITVGWVGSGLEFGLYVLGILMLWSTDRLLIFFFIPSAGMESEVSEELEDHEPAPEVSKAVPAHARGRLATFAGRLSLSTLAAMFGGLGTLQVIAILGFATSQMVQEKTDRLVGLLQRSTLPEEQNGFKLARFETTQQEFAGELGVHSAKWVYQRPQAQAEVVCDFPFGGWDDLNQTFRGKGWDVIERQIIALPADRDPTQASLVQAHLRRADGVRGVLLLSLVDDAGRPLQPPGTAGLSASSWYRAINDRVQRRLTGFGIQLETYQVHLLLTGEAATKPAVRESARELFVRSRELIMRRLQEDGGGDS